MCLQYIKLKTKNEFGTRYGYVPCGKCVDCRRKEANAWKFRLNSEFSQLKKRGWNVAFCTLTYSNDKLPHLPKEVFADENINTSIPCFSRTDVRKWIDDIRQYCKYHYGFKNSNNIRYFIASEFGSITHRPHYHAILAWPNSVSYEDMHKLVKSKWSNGILFPRRPEGGVEHGKVIKSFEVVGDESRALGYVAKYACKDLDFYNVVDAYKIKTKSRLWRNVQPFHMQSKSLGFEVVKNMTNEEKRNILINGMSFNGNGEVYQIPVYIKNKIFYDNYYVMENGKRLVKRKASEYFEKYRKEIFNEKAKFYQTVFTPSISEDYFIKRGVASENAKKFSKAVEYYKYKLDCAAGYDVSVDIGKLYLAYFGVKRESCKYFDNIDDLHIQWMCRYRKPEMNEQLMRGRDEIDYYSWKCLQDYCAIVLGVNTYCNLLNVDKRENEEAMSRKIRDYFNNVLGPRLV